MTEHPDDKNGEIEFPNAYVLKFEYSDFEIVSDFEFRYSDFSNASPINFLDIFTNSVKKIFRIKSYLLVLAPVPR